MINADVVVIGCGPAGALIANLLGKRGVKTLVLEAAKEIHPLPRAIGMDDEVLRVLQALDLDSAYTDTVYSLKGMDLLRGNRKRLRRFTLNAEDRTLGFPLLTLFHQPTLEGHIRSGLGRYGDLVDVRLGAEVQSILDTGEGVEVKFIDPLTQTEQTVAARFALGCDGARSLVRTSFDVGQHDLDLHQPWVVVDVIMNREIEISGFAEQICDPKRPGTFVPAPPPRNRWEFMIMPGDDPDEMVKPETLKELIRPWADPDAYEVERVAIYTFHALIARSWRMGAGGNVLLLGDAAHQMPPFLGQGMCAGVRDTFNLAWKLDLVLRGLAGNDLLDTYETERAHHVRKVIELAVQIGTIIQSPSKIHSFFVNLSMVLAEMLQIQLPVRSAKMIGIGDGFTSASHALPRRARIPFPQPLVRTAQDDGVRMDECLGRDFTLLRSDGEDPGFEGTDLITVRRVLRANHTGTLGPNDMVDTEGVLERWMKDNRCQAVLLRPDRQVFGIYNAPQANLDYVSSDLTARLATDSIASPRAAAS